MFTKLNLKVFETLKSANRNASVDFFRALAILSVVIYHFKRGLLYGYLGVDLFFVISGLLIGGLLVKDLKSGQPINFFKFILQRGFKIWPSYFIFLILGSVLANILYQDIQPIQIIPLNDYARYVFFYLNYTGNAAAAFAHLWSICVEEHFYIMLPLLFILIQKLFNNKIYLFSAVSAVIAAGIIFKYLSHNFTKSTDVTSGTHNRIDALAWGVLLSLIVAFYPDLIKPKLTKIILFTVGLIMFCFALLIRYFTDSINYIEIGFHSIVPFCFFLMLAGTYYMNIRFIGSFRFIAYFSYNWYLWHQLFGFAITYYFGKDYLGFIIYITISFSTAILFTIIVEEPFLSMRKSFLTRLFPK